MTNHPLGDYTCSVQDCGERFDTKAEADKHWTDKHASGLKVGRDETHNHWYTK